MEVTIKQSYKNVEILESKNQYAVKNENGDFVVPFGKYAWIDNFYRGLARVHTNGRSLYTKNTIAIIDLESVSTITDKREIEKEVMRHHLEHPEEYQKWGIINTQGEEVVPLKYDEIWNFKKEEIFSTRAFINGIKEQIDLRRLPGFNDD